MLVIINRLFIYSVFVILIVCLSLWIVCFCTHITLCLLTLFGLSTFFYSSDDLHIQFYHWKFMKFNFFFLLFLFQMFWNLFPSKIWDLLSELSPHQALQILPILAHQITLLTFWECSHSKAGNSSFWTLQVEYFRFVLTGWPEQRNIYLLSKYRFLLRIWFLFLLC